MVTRTAIGDRGTGVWPPSLSRSPRPSKATGVRPGRAVQALIVVTMALTPMINPKGPGHTALVDFLMLFCIFAIFVWALRNRVQVRLPYVIPMTCLMVTGLVAALLSVAPANGALAISQEIFLLLWCGALTTFCRAPSGLRLLLRAWGMSATAWAVLTVVAAAAGVHSLLGTTPGGGARVRLFFDHPNMAGNYFMISAFIVVASGFPRRLWLRSGAVGLLLLATLLTGSNAALLSLVGGVAVMFFLHLRARTGLIKATAVVALTLGGLAVGWLVVGQPLLTAVQNSDNSLVRYSVGRGAQSAEGRAALFEQQLAVFERGKILGIGPATTFLTLDAEGASIVKEAHSDYLGTLVERGPLGLAAVFGLFGTVIARLIAPTKKVLSPRLHAVVPVPAAIAGACMAFALTAVTHETLHYRWLFTLLAIVAAMHLLVRAEDGSARPAGKNPRPPSTGVVRASAT